MKLYLLRYGAALCLLTISMGLYAFGGSASTKVQTEVLTGRHGKQVEVATYSKPSGGASAPAGPWSMSRRSPENKIVAHCGEDRCKACIITFQNLACYAAVRGGGFSASNGSGVTKAGQRSDGTSCTYKDTPDSRNSSLTKAALPDGFRARSTQLFSGSAKYNQGKVGNFPPLGLDMGRAILVHSRREPLPGELGRIPRYGLPRNATLRDIEATSNSWGCPIVSDECMGKLQQFRGLPFEVREVAGEVNHNDFK